MSASSASTWGRVTAEPHEHLIHIRRGEVVGHGQGGSVFCWPGDSVALVDTSVKRLQFTADQVTREKVGVGITGLAVIRVVEPLLAYRMLNVGDSDSYEHILQQMFVGATRRLVANLTLEDCITRRKDALASELMAEVAPVVRGRGRTDDDTDRGWGVAIDTIEIQDVRVLSDEVFESLQAPYRENLSLGAMRARADVQAEQARLDEQRVAHEAHLAAMEQQARLERVRGEAASRVKVAEQEAAARRIEGEAQAEVEARLREAAMVSSPERLQELMLTETLPRVAEAFRGSFDKVVVTGGDLSVLGSGLAQVLAVAEGMGVELPAMPPMRKHGRRE
jgi:flotillin